MDAGVDIDFVVELDVNDEEIIERLSGRRVHPASGRVYHIKYNPPKQEGKDDQTGDDLVLRDDDREETVRKRLEVYHQQTKPLVDFYQSASRSGTVKFSSVIGTGKVSDITVAVLACLEK